MLFNYIIGQRGIQGPPGPSGSQGLIGPSGIQGPQGIQGIIGPSGLMGPSGLQGQQGIQGPSGIQGSPGPSGSQGIPGASGTNDPQLRIDFENASGVWVKDGINLGLTGSGIFTSKDASQRLQFKKIKAGSNVTITGDSNSLTISSLDTDTGEVNTASNVGSSGLGWFKQKVGSDLEFKKVVAGDNISLVLSADSIRVVGVAPGEVNTASNVGNGIGVFDSKSGVDLRFKRILGGSGVEVRASGQTIILDNELVDDFIILNSEVVSNYLDFTNSSGVFLKTGSNLGSGSEVFKQKVGSNLEFRTLIAGSGMQFTIGPNTITIDNQLQDDVDILYTRSNSIRTDFDNASGIFIKTASNVGFGQGVFDSKVGSDLRFKKILGGSGIEVRASGQTLILDNELSDDVDILYERSDSIRTDFANSSGIFVKDGENLGATGSGIFFTKSALQKLQFKKLKAGSNITITGDNNSLTISAVSGVQQATTVRSVASANSVGTVQRYAHEDHAHAGLIQAQISGNTSNTSNVIQGSLVLAGGNNVTLSQVSAAGAATITISAANQTIQTQNCVDLSIAGNTAGTPALVSSGTVIIAGGNNITLSQDGNSITISGADAVAPSIATAVQSVGTANSVGTITRYSPEDHVHGGVVQWKITGNTNGSTSNNSQSIQGSLVLSGAGGISVAQTPFAGGGSVRISCRTIPAQANGVEPIGGIGVVGVSTNYSPEDHVHAGVYRILWDGNVTYASQTGGTAGGTFTIGGPRSFLGDVYISAGTNISLSAIITGTLTQTNATVTLYGPNMFSAGLSDALGNTTGTTGLVSNRLILAGGSNITLSESINGGSATISIIGGAAVAPSIATTVSSVGSANSVGTVTRYAPEDHVHAGVIQVQISGNTLNTSNVIQGSLVIAGGNNITLSQVSAAGAASITIVGRNFATISELSPYTIDSYITNSSLANNAVFMIPFLIPQYMYALRLNMFWSVATTVSGTGGASAGLTQSVALYARQTDSTAVISSFWSQSAFLNLSASSNTRISVTHPVGILTTGGTTAFSSSSFQQQNATASNYLANSVAGFRVVHFPIHSTFTPGQYWLAVAKQSTSQSGSVVVNISNLMFTLTQMPGFEPFNVVSKASNATAAQVPLQGMGTLNATTLAFPASVNLQSGGAVPIAMLPNMQIPVFNFSGWNTANDML